MFEVGDKVKLSGVRAGCGGYRHGDGCLSDWHEGNSLLKVRFAGASVLSVSLSEGKKAGEPSAQSVHPSEIRYATEQEIADAERPKSAPLRPGDVSVIDGVTRVVISGPDRDNDFIVARIGDDWGFVGGDEARRLAENRVGRLTGALPYFEHDTSVSSLRVQAEEVAPLSSPFTLKTSDGQSESWGLGDVVAIQPSGQRLPVTGAHESGGPRVRWINDGGHEDVLILPHSRVPTAAEENATFRKGDRFVSIRDGLDKTKGKVYNVASVGSCGDPAARDDRDDLARFERESIRKL